LSEIDKADELKWSSQGAEDDDEARSGEKTANPLLMGWLGKAGRCAGLKPAEQDNSLLKCGLPSANLPKCL